MSNVHWDPAYQAFTESARQAAAGPSPDPVREILAVLSEPLGLAGGSLAAYGVPGDGCCRECLRPPVHSQGLCVYCGTLEAARGPARESRRRAASVFLIACAFWGMIVSYIAFIAVFVAEHIR